MGNGQSRRTMLPHKALGFSAFTVRVACSTPRVSDTGDAQCISPYHTFFSNCVVQRMRAWSLPAIPLRARLSVGRSAARWRRALRGSDPSPPAQATESRISLGSRRNSARCARTAPDSPRRVVSACDDTEPQTKRVFRRDARERPRVANQKKIGHRGSP